MKLLRFLFFMSLLAGVLFSCRDVDDIPDISYQPISKQYLQGGWRFVDNQILWDISAKGSSINDIYDFKSLLADNIKSSTNCVSVYFANDTLMYVVRHLPTDTVPYFRGSNYMMNSDGEGFVIVLSNPYVMGFYAPIVYLKTIDHKNQLTFYLRRDEVMNIIQNSSETKPFANLIRSEVNNAEVDLYAVRDTLEYYSILDAYSGIVR